jgi:hypothetical protein
VPALLLHGDADRVVPASHSEWLARHIPGAELRISPGNGHIPVLRETATAVAWLGEQASKLAANVEDCPPNHACVEGIEIVTLATGSAGTWPGSSMAGLHALLECPQFGCLDGSTFTPLPGSLPGLPNAPTVSAAW